MGNLGFRDADGFVDANNPLGAGFWTVRFDQGNLRIPIDFEIYHIAVKGPPGSTFQVFINTTFYDNVPHGDVNSWDPNQPMYVHTGSELFFYYSTSAGTTAPHITLSCREPTA